MSIDEQLLPLFERLAREQLNIPTLRVQGSDALDFHSISVRALRDVMRAAYDTGAGADTPVPTPALTPDDPVTAVAVSAIGDLATLLGEARAYFAEGETLAALGTLVMFDDAAEDLRAAIRLCQMQRRRR